VRLLLDTHIVLWWFSDDPRLPGMARVAITQPANQLIVSAVVGYEIVYKQNQGRLPPLPEFLRVRLIREGIEILPITMDHALAAAALPGPHRDPWDRIMMAQAVAEGLTVVTVDPAFGAYAVPVLS